MLFNFSKIRFKTEKMKNVLCKSAATSFLLLSFLFILISCSDSEYVNAVPENSTAIVSVDILRLAESNGGVSYKEKLKELFKVNDIEDCGLDLSEKLYVFETIEGNIGFVAKVADKADLDTWLNKLSDKGYCKKTDKRKDCRFTVIKDSWVAGFSSDALMIIGPVLPAGQAEVRQQIIKYLGQDEDRSIKVSPLFERLNSSDNPVAIVAQAAALPDKFVAPFTIGAPKDADASQIMISAEVKSHRDFLEIIGEPFSFNEDIDKSLKEAFNVFRPITDRYLGSMPDDAFLGAFMNVDGKDFINLLHANKSFQTLLAGVNMAIDMDNIIKSIDGDMVLVMPDFNDNNTLVRLGAKLRDKDFLKDVNYWKQSCPAGSKIEDWGKDAYRYTNGSLSYYFGVSEDMQYYSGSTPDDANNSISKATKTLPEDIQSRIKGQKICFVLNVKSLINDDKSGLFSDFMAPLFGNTGYILYNVK